MQKDVYDIMLNATRMRIVHAANHDLPAYQHFN